jgi:hypothetical protein
LNYEPERSAFETLWARHFDLKLRTPRTADCSFADAASMRRVLPLTDQTGAPFFDNNALLGALGAGLFSRAHTPE